jgi:hypothetical protein
MSSLGNWSNPTFMNILNQVLGPGSSTTTAPPITPLVAIDPRTPTANNPGGVFNIHEINNSTPGSNSVTDPGPVSEGGFLGMSNTTLLFAGLAIIALIYFLKKK